MSQQTVLLQTLGPFSSCPKSNFVVARPKLRSCAKQEVEGKLFVESVTSQGISAYLFVESHLHQFMYLVVFSYYFGVVLGPLRSCEVKEVDVCFEHSSNFSILRIVYLIQTVEHIMRLVSSKNEINLSGAFKTWLIRLLI